MVVSVRDTLVSVFVTTTVALGTAAPDGSVTVPTMFPFPDVWAITGKVEQSENTKAVTATLSALTQTTRHKSKLLFALYNVARPKYGSRTRDRGEEGPLSVRATEN